MYHKNQPNVGKYTSPMDPMESIKLLTIDPIETLMDSSDEI